MQNFYKRINNNWLWVYILVKMSLSMHVLLHNFVAYRVFLAKPGFISCCMTSIWPIIPALFLFLLASYYSQNYAGILASPLHAIEFRGSNQRHLSTLNTSFYCQWLLSIIGYILDEGFSHLKLKFSLYFGIPVRHFYNIICLLNIEIYFHFGFHTIYSYKICYDWWHIVIVSNLIGDCIFLWSFLLHVTRPLLGSGYKTRHSQQDKNLFKG